MRVKILLPNYSTSRIETPFLTFMLYKPRSFSPLFSQVSLQATSRFSKTLTSINIATPLARLNQFDLLPAWPQSRYQPLTMSLSPDAIIVLIVLGLFFLTLIILSPAVCVLVFYGKLTPWVILFVVGADILITVASLGLFTPGASLPFSL